MKNYLFAIILLFSINLNAQHTYDSTTLYVDLITTVGAASFSQEDATVTLGFSPQVGFRVRDATTELYLEITAGYNAMSVYLDSDDHSSNEYYKNVDINMGIFISKIFSIKIGGFYFSKNDKRSEYAFGGMVSTQLEFPLTKSNNLLLIVNGNAGVNFKNKSPYQELLRGSIGVAYNFLNKQY